MTSVPATTIISQVPRRTNERWKMSIKAMSEIVAARTDASVRLSELRTHLAAEHGVTPRRYRFNLWKTLSEAEKEHAALHEQTSVGHSS